MASGAAGAAGAAGSGAAGSLVDQFNQGMEKAHAEVQRVKKQGSLPLEQIAMLEAIVTSLGKGLARDVVGSMPGLASVQSMDQLPETQRRIFVIKALTATFSAFQQAGDLPDGKESMFSSCLSGFHSQTYYQFLPKNVEAEVAEILPSLVALQGAVRKTLKPDMVSGPYKGLLYEIKDKDSRTLGYLLGTIHAVGGLLDSSLLRPTGPILHRLSQCSILGLERTEDKPLVGASSVEQHLVGVAKQGATLQVGLDTPDAEDIFAKLISAAASAAEGAPSGDKKPEPKSKSSPEQVYGSGDYEAIKADCLAGHLNVDGIKGTLGVDVNPAARNEAMAKNIDALLRSCATAGGKEAQSPQAFFAIGTAHLFSRPDGTGPSVVELLQKQGWNVTLSPAV